MGLASLICTVYLGYCNYKFTKELTPQLKISKANFSKKHILELISSGIWNTFSKLSSILSSGLDLLISNLFVGSVGMGIISCTKTLSNVVLNAFGSISSVFSPELTISYAKKDYDDMKHQLLFAVKLLGLFSAIPLTIILAYGNNFYSIWIPSQNANLLYWLTIVSTMALTISLPLEPLWNIFTVTNKVKISSLYLFINSVVTIIITFILLFLVKDNTVRLFIIVGVSTVFSVIRSLTFLPIYGSKCIKLPKITFYPVIFKNLFVIVLSTIISFGIKQVINIDSWFTLIIASIISSIFIVIINLFIVLNKQERIELLKKFKVLLYRIFKKQIDKKNNEFINKILVQTEIDDQTILFESEGDFADNARVLYEYIIDNKMNKKYKIIWIVDDPTLYKTEDNVIFISRRRESKKELIQFYSYVGSAKYLFFTHPYWYKKVKEGQVIINLWHGVPLKAGGTDRHKIFDYITIPSEFSKDLFHKILGTVDSQYLVTGLARNDLLFKNTKSINKIIDMKNNPKVIICMTTFKQSLHMKDSSIVFPYVLPFVENGEELNEINKQLVKANIKLIIKIHHLQKTELVNQLNLSNIIYIEDKDLNLKDIQLYELIGQTDALITDYSSVMFDYMLIDKPIGYFINDLEDYKKTRGFLVDNINDYLVGEKMTTKEDFYNFINQVSNNDDKYKQQRRKFNSKMNKYKDNNCKRILDCFNIKL